MATKAVVKTGTVSGSSGTWDFTESGFGTPDAAIVILGLAHTGGNPLAYANISIGFWDGTSQRSSQIYCSDAQITSNTDRTSSATYVATQNSTGSLGYTISNITDGVRLTHAAGATTASRYVTVILLGGLSNKYVGTTNLGTGTSAINVTAPGFRADLVLVTCTGQNSDAANGTAAVLSFGAAHIAATDTVSQGCVLFGSKDASADSLVNLQVREDAVAGQYYDDTLSWRASISANASGFSITPNASAGSDRIYYLALEFADAADAFVDIKDTATSTGSQATTGAGTTPDVLLLASTMATALDTDCSNGTINIGATDGTTTRSIGVVDEDAQTISDNETWSTDSYIVQTQSAVGSVDAQASVTSLDSGGWTLNYADASSSATKILAIAIGTASAGATTLTVADATHGHSADNIALTQAHTLALADSTHAHSVDNVALTQAHALALADAAHGQSVDPVALTQANILSLVDATHGHSVDPVALTQAGTLVVADTTHGQSAESPVLTQANTLFVADALHGQTANPVSLTQAHTLALADATHGHSAEAVALDTSYTLALADALHGHSADPVALTQANTLSVQEATQGQTADPVALTQANILVLADATHGHTSDAIALDTSAVLVVAETFHTQGADGNLSLLQTALLVIADALHAQLADAAGTLDCVSLSTGSVVCTCEVVAYPLNAGAWLDQESSACPEAGSPSTWKTETLRIDYCNICVPEPWCDINTPPPATWRTNYDC